MSKTFKCDVCRKDLNNDDGFLSWKSDSNGKFCDFKITHRVCTPAQGKDLNIEIAYSENGIMHLLLMVESGGVSDIASWVEVFKRLQVPHYEEARQYFSQAKRDGLFDFASLYDFPSQNSLQDVIDTYAPKKIAEDIFWDI